MVQKKDELSFLFCKKKYNLEKWTNALHELASCLKMKPIIAKCKKKRKKKCKIFMHIKIQVTECVWHHIKVYLRLEQIGMLLISLCLKANAVWSSLSCYHAHWCTILTPINAPVLPFFRDVLVTLGVWEYLLVPSVVQKGTTSWISARFYVGCRTFK